MSKMHRKVLSVIIYGRPVNSISKVHTIVNAGISLPYGGLETGTSLTG
jgi:hypothetical protein